MIWLFFALGCGLRLPPAPIGPGEDGDPDDADTDGDPSDTDTDAREYPEAPWDGPFPTTGACGALASPLPATDADDLEAGLSIAFAMVDPAESWDVYAAWYSVAEQSSGCPSGGSGSHYAKFDTHGGCTTPGGWLWQGAWYAVYEDVVDGAHYADEFTGTRVRFADAAGAFDLWMDGSIDGNDKNWVPRRYESHFTYGFVGTGPYFTTEAHLGWYRVDRVVGFDAGVPTDMDAYIYVADDGSGGPTGDLCLRGTLTRVRDCEEPDGRLTIEAATPAELVFDGATACDGCAEIVVDGVAAGQICP